MGVSNWHANRLRGSEALLAQCVDDICMPPEHQYEADKWNRL